MPPWLHLSIAARRGADEMHPLSLPPMRQANNDTATLSWIQANLPNWNATSDSWKVRKGARHFRGIETDRFQLHHLCLAWPRDSPAGQPFGVSRTLQCSGPPNLWRLLVTVPLPHRPCFAPQPLLNLNLGIQAQQMALLNDSVPICNGSPAGNVCTA